MLNTEALYCNLNEAVSCRAFLPAASLRYERGRYDVICSTVRWAVPRSQIRTSKLVLSTSPVWCSSLCHQKSAFEKLSLLPSDCQLSMESEVRDFRSASVGKAVEVWDDGLSRKYRACHHVYKIRCLTLEYGKALLRILRQLYASSSSCPLKNASTSTGIPPTLWTG